jgi:hypothetical protein
MDRSIADGAVNYEQCANSPKVRWHAPDASSDTFSNYRRSIRVGGLDKSQKEKSAKTHRFLSIRWAAMDSEQTRTIEGGALL